MQLMFLAWSMNISWIRGWGLFWLFCDRFTGSHDVWVSVMPSVLQMLPFGCGFADPSVIDKGVSCRNTSAGSSGTGGCRKCTCQPWCALAASGDPLGCWRSVGEGQIVTSFHLGYSHKHEGKLKGSTFFISIHKTKSCDSWHFLIGNQQSS